MLVVAVVVQMFPYFFTHIGTVLYIQHRVCLQLQQLQSCDSASVSSLAALWSTLCTTCSFGLSCLAVASFGPRSDTSGRRLLFVLPAIGNLICYLLAALVMLWDLSLWILFLGFFVSGVMGSHYLFLTGVHSSISDMTEDKHLRAARFSIAEGTQMLTQAVAYTCSGIILHAIGFAYCFILVVIVQLVSLAYMLVLPESLSSDSVQRTPLCSGSRSVLSPMSILTRSIGHAAVALTVAVLTLTVPLASVSVLYVRHVYDWSATTTGYFAAISHALKGMGCTVFLPILKAHGPGVSEKLLLIISILSTAAVYSFTGMVRQPSSMWLVQSIWPLAGMAAPLAKSLLSKHCCEFEQGNAFSLLFIIESWLGLFAPTLIQSGIYSTTVAAGCAGCAFYAVSLLLVCLAMFLSFVSLSPSLLSRPKIGLASQAFDIITI